MFYDILCTPFFKSSVHSVLRAETFSFRLSVISCCKWFLLIPMYPDGGENRKIGDINPFKSPWFRGGCSYNPQ